MGEIKKIDVFALAAQCRQWLPAFRAAEHLCNIGVAAILSRREEYISLADIVAESKHKASGTYRIISLAVRAGLIEKNPDGGRGPLYRATPLFQDVINAKVFPETLHTISTNAVIFEALNSERMNQTALCEKTGIQQTTISLKMKRLVADDWVDRIQDGKEVWYSLSDQARRVFPIVAAELGKMPYI